jgi:hypothetical protein
VLDLLAKPRGKVKARTLRIPYEVAGAPGTEVEYRHDDSGWRATRRSPLVLRRLDPGRHTLALRAIDAAGRGSPRVTVRFRVVAG